jgi:hypothetical protein
VARDIGNQPLAACARFDRLREAGTPRRGDMIGALFSGVAFVLAGRSPLAELLPSPALTARRLAATLKAAGEVFPYRYTVQVAGTLDLNDAAPLSPIRLPARTAATRLAPRKPQPPATAPRQTTPPATHTIHAQPGSQASLKAPAAADARSVRLRFSDVSCVILSRLGASDAAPSSPNSLSARTAATRLAPRKPQPPATAPSATTPPVIHIIHAQPAFASTLSQRSCRR